MKRIKLKCAASTYIDEFNLNKNFFTKEYILSGIIYKNPSNFNNFKSLLEFNTSSLNTNEIKSVVLGVFINDLNFSFENSANIKIVGTTNDIANVTWSNCSSVTSSNELVTEIATNMMGKYVEIDITNIFKDSLPYNNNNYGVIIDVIKHNYTSIVQFASVNSPYPPYLLLSINSDKNNINETNYGEESVSKIRREDNNVKGKDFEVLLNNFESLNSKLNILEQFLSNKVDALAEWIKSTNIKVDVLIDAINETNSKLENLRNEINENINNKECLGCTIDLTNEKVESLVKELRETNNNMGKDIVNINDTVIKVNNNTNKLVKLLGNMTIETFE